MVDKHLVDEIEGIFVSELGVGSAFIFKQKLRELGLNRKSLNRNDIEKIVGSMLKEYDKVLGSYANIIRQEILTYVNH